jgi:hypothetical protein
LQQAAQAEPPAEPAGPPSLSWLVQGPPVDRPDGTPVHAVRPPRRRRTAAMIGGLLLVAILAIGGVLLFSVLRPGGDGAGGPEAGGTPATGEATPTETPTADAEPSPTATPPAPSPTANPVTETPPPAPTPEQRLAGAVADYYALMPGNLDAAWPLMTADYQENHVGGRAAYDAFWGDVVGITISDVVATAPDRAQATLTYSFSDGSVVQEVTAYRFVDEGGQLKIAETDVLSSVTL